MRSAALVSEGPLAVMASIVSSQDYRRLEIGVGIVEEYSGDSRTRMQGSDSVVRGFTLGWNTASSYV